MGLSFHLGLGQWSRGTMTQNGCKKLLHTSGGQFLTCSGGGRVKRGQIRSGLGPTQSIKMDPRLIVSRGERACVCEGPLARLWEPKPGQVDGIEFSCRRREPASENICKRRYTSVCKAPASLWRRLIWHRRWILQRG